MRRDIRHRVLSFPGRQERAAVGQCGACHAMADRGVPVRVLLVEDEETLHRQLVERLHQEGFAVDQARDGEEGLYFGKEYPADVGVIDLGLPKLSGIQVIQRLRAAGKVFPILILTARDRWQDKVEGLEAGADDYLVKPFHIEELLARLNALVRRAAGWTQPLLECGPIALDTRQQKVTVNGLPIDLTAYEFKVLEFLMLHASEVVSKSALTEHVYDQDFDRDSNVLEVFIGRLRRKLDPENRFQPIETLRGRGYRFTLPRRGG
jgi:two-component system, OmpR family, response regulator PhoP